MPIIRFYNITLHSNYLCHKNDQHMDDNNDFKKLKKHENRVYNIVKLSISEGADFCLNTLPPPSQTGRYAKVIYTLYKYACQK